ncbi:MAG: UbiD family decarboxylase [Desulfovibrio sp.]|nr:UbiD family decarboxylase [Desulfovibrio sp.]
MPYASLARCVKDLEEVGQLKRIELELDPYLEIPAIQRRVFAAKGPALLFTKVKGTPFPLLGNLFGTRERLEFIFRKELPKIRALFEFFGQGSLAKKPFTLLRRLGGAILPLLHLRTRSVAWEAAPVLKETCGKEDLPRLVSWPLDGGPFITLPLVYSEDPAEPGWRKSNLGMYRVQMSGNDYTEQELGLHYQLHRGLGVHHARALEKGLSLPVNIYVGGPPALTLAAIMPLPEGLSELHFAGLLGGEGLALAKNREDPLPVLADADFCLTGHLGPVTKDEGPFGDHLGYYSGQHPFPVFNLKKIYHRPHAIWPFTSVGRPPQEDTIFGDFIHELTAPFLPKVFAGVEEVHAVDAAGVHPLLLAIGHERYTPYEVRRKPREILTQALHLLGTTQTSLAKYLFIVAREDAPALSTRDLPGFFRHVLERTDFSRDLHYLPKSTCDTLDYTGGALHEGSKLIWAAAGERVRSLACELTGLSELPKDFGPLGLALPGILVVQGPKHELAKGEEDARLAELACSLADCRVGERYPLVVLVDDVDFVVRNIQNFLWVTFTRSDPAHDTYGANAKMVAKQWFCEPPLIIDARKKAFHALELKEDPEVSARVLELAKNKGPLAGLW